MLQIPWYYKGY